MNTAVAIVLVALGGAPALAIRLTGSALPVELATLLFGCGIVAAAFAMSWGAEAAEHDIPRSLALLTVALLAVLPEYAVDIVFAWKAAREPAFTAYAAANMTGSNRLLLGLGWPAIVVTVWLLRREHVVALNRGSVPGLLFLGIATVYSFALPFKATISVIDSVVLGALFTVYAIIAARAPVIEPELVGPAAAIGSLSRWPRRAAILGLFAFALAEVFAAAEPFAEGLVHTGTKLGIDEFLLVQWLAPLASEAPEFLVAILLAVHGKPGAGLGLLVSSKINQWTLLVGSLPIAYSVGMGHVAALPLDERQVAEVLLTAAQSVFGLGTLASLSLSLKESGVLAGLFLAQLVASGVLREALHRSAAADAELLAFSVLYVVLGLGALGLARRHIVAAVRGTTS